MQLLFMQLKVKIELLLDNSAVGDGFILTLQLPLYLHLAQ